MAETAYVPRLRTQYDETIKPGLIKEFGYKNVMQAPKLDKIVLNMGVGEATQDKKKVETAAKAVEASAKKVEAAAKKVEADAKKAIAKFVPLAPGKPRLVGDVTVTLTPVGHLLGASAVTLLVFAAIILLNLPLALIGGVKGAVVTTVVVAGVAVAAGNNGGSNTSGTTK